MFGRILPRNGFGDAVFTSAAYLRCHRRLPRWRRPVTFNDHLFRLKQRGDLNDPLRQYVSDKHFVKRYIAHRVGAAYALETFDLLESEAEIDAYRPARRPCVIKPTHLSGRVMLVDDRNPDPDRDLLKRWMRLNYYEESREANYKHLRPRIMAEECFVDPVAGVPHDYKVFCIGGRAKFLHVIRDRFGKARRNAYSINWTQLPFGINKPSQGTVPRPACLEEIVRVAERLAEPFGFIRVDFLVAGGRPKIGELTNLPGNALSPFLPATYDRLLGEMFDDPMTEVEQILCR